MTSSGTPNSEKQNLRAEISMTWLLAEISKDILNSSQIQLYTTNYPEGIREHLAFAKVCFVSL